MEMTCSFGMPVTFIPDDRSVHNHRWENFKSHAVHNVMISWKLDNFFTGWETLTFSRGTLLHGIIQSTDATGARGSVVVKALRYYPECRGFETPL
jgi:hypothetical protein